MRIKLSVTGARQIGPEFLFETVSKLQMERAFSPCAS
jgi:hypothetical protein